MRDVLFLDANVIMYALGKDHPLRDPCRKCLERVKRGEIAVLTNTEVVQEIFHRYFAIRMPNIAEEAYAAMKTFCNEILPVTLRETDKALALLKKHPSINARDAVHAATMLNHGVEKVLSADPHFDAIHGIRLVVPC